MYTYLIVPLVILILILLTWIMVSWKINRVSSPAYRIIAKKKDYELRAYEQYVVAETIVEGERLAATNVGFKILAAYIFGDNVSRTKLDMSAPVIEQVQSPVKLAMTAPVMVRDNSKHSHVISFVMPRGSTIANLPQPNDSRIVFNAIFAHSVAVRTFSWYLSEKRIQKQKNLLNAALIRDGVVQEGSISYAGYTAPFTIPFMEKHEVMVVVQRY